MGQTVHEELSRRLEEARLGGSERNRKKVMESGKMLVGQRLELLFDEGRPMTPPARRQALTPV